MTVGISGMPLAPVMATADQLAALSTAAPVPFGSGTWGPLPPACRSVLLRPSARVTRNSAGHGRRAAPAAAASAAALAGALGSRAFHSRRRRAGRTFFVTRQAVSDKWRDVLSDDEKASLQRLASEVAEAEDAERPIVADAPAEPETTREEHLFKQHLRASEVKKGLKSGRFVQGQLKMMRNTCYFGIVTIGHEEIAVSGGFAMNRAVDGDTIVLERLDEIQQQAYESASQKRRHRTRGGRVRSEADEMEEALERLDRKAELSSSKKPRGRVVHIVKRSKRALVGSIQPLEDTGKRGPEKLEPGERVFLPSGRHFPFMILRPLPEEAGDDFAGDDCAGKRVSVQLDVWDRNSEYPRGHWLKTLGDAGDLEVETQMILKEYQIKDEPFTDEVLAELPPADFQPSEKDLDGREDFRGVCVCSIDPPGCEDVDDALSCEELPNGNFRVGVHIADVSHFIKAGSQLDLEAADRCTSTYLVDRRIDMLPRLLTTDICSLRCDGKDRLTFSSIFEITPEAVVVESRFCKTVIVNKAALSYAEAQARLDGEDTDEITKSVKTLSKLAVILRAQRMKDGALELESEELSFEIDEETKLPINLFKYESFSTNKLIEEFMLLANRYAATTLAEAFPRYGVLRQHPAPKVEDMQELTELLACHNITDFDSSSNRALAESLKRVNKPDDPFFNRLVRIMATRCMNEAKYFCTGMVKKSEWDHYGLAMSRYTHFTSPIRRFADVIVHRLMSAALELNQLAKVHKDKASIEEQIARLNVRNKNARHADRASSDLHQYLYFKAKGSVIAEGIVMRIKQGKPSSGLGQAANPSEVQVAVQEYGAEGYMQLSPRDWRVFDDRQAAMGRPMSPYQGTKIELFDRIIVKVEADTEDGRSRTLKFSFVSLPEGAAGQKKATPAEEMDEAEVVAQPSATAVAERESMDAVLSEVSAES